MQSRFYHFCGMHSFVSGPLFQYVALQQAYSTARPEARPSPPRRFWRPGRPRPRPRGQSARPRRRRRPRPALAGVVVMYVFIAVAVPAGGARRSHVPGPARSSASLLWTSSSQRAPRCSGRPRRWHPTLLRLRRHCRRRNSTAGKLPTAYQVTAELRCPAPIWPLVRHKLCQDIGQVVRGGL